MSTATDLADIIRTGIPGYDPHDQAGDCRFDEQAAADAIGFFEECLKHVEGKLAGQPFVLERWEQAIVGNLFGWKRPDGTRRYREALIFVARKNGKTSLCAGLVLLLLFTDGEPGAQIYSAAADAQQARLVFSIAKQMVLTEPELAARCRVYHNSIVIEESASSYKAISAEASTKHGFNSHAVVVDELHAQPNRELVDVLTTSTGARQQPLIVHITTADFCRESICNEKHAYACKVRDNKGDPDKPGYDAAFLPVIYEAQPEDDWTDPEVWKKANPNFGVSISEEYLQRECQRAQETPTYENTFKRLHLNMKTQQDVRWMPVETWDACAGLDGVDSADWRTATVERLRGQRCCGGLDMSTSQDLTALVLLFEEDTRRIVLPFFWCPADNAEHREKRDRVPYITWGRRGFVRLTEGNVVDYDAVRADIQQLAEMFGILAIGIDPWNATQISTQLMGDGLRIEKVGQGFANMSGPTKELERLILTRQIVHGGNPILAWNIANSAAETDHAGNIKLSKKKSTERIDGAVALVMAIGLAIQNMSISTASIYDEPGNVLL